MPRESGRDRGRRRGRELTGAIARDLTDARLSAGLSQRHVAHTSGLYASRISRTERAAGAAPRIDELAVHATVLGLRMSVKFYPEGSPVRDRAHLELMRRLRAYVAQGYRWRSEVPVGGPGDLRAWDVVLDGPATIGIDAETRIHDLQDLQRRMELKLRDSVVAFAVLLASSTRHNRRVLREHRAALASTFAFDTAPILQALQAGTAPPGNGIVLL